MYRRIAGALAAGLSLALIGLVVTAAPSSAATRSASIHGARHHAAPHVPGPVIDPRCLTGRVICINKTTREVRWMVDGQELLRLDARFGAPRRTPTREGVFSVTVKSRDHVSTIYHTAMPFALFFAGGQAVHYSADFAARGYRGASHGCVNIRDYDSMAWLFDQVQVGDTVIVYRS